MVSDRGRPPERQDDQGQQTRRRDSQSQPRSSRERLEQMRREGGMSSDQQENLRRANEALLNRLRPHLTQRFLDLLEEDPIGHRQVPPLHIINHALNTINETMNMSVMERRESNQRSIDHASDEDRHRFSTLLLRDEIDRLRAHVNEMPAMEQLDELLPWEAHLPTEWRRLDSGVVAVFAPGMRQIREQTENMPEAERHERRRT